MVSEMPLTSNETNILVVCIGVFATLGPYLISLQV